MKKFVFIYTSKGNTEPMSEEAMKNMMDVWMAWFETFKDKLVDGGNPFGPNAKAVSKGSVKDISALTLFATGYTIINAADIDEAVKIAQTCPALEDTDGGVQVYEAMPM